MENFTKYDEKYILMNIERLKEIRETLLSNMENNFTSESLTTLNLIQEALNFLIDLIDDSYEIEYPFHISKPNIYASMKNDFKTIGEKGIYIPTVSDFLLKGYEHFIDTPFYHEYFNMETPTDTSYTNEEILELTHDFYKTLPDHEIRTAFLKSFVNRYKNYRITGRSSETMSLPFINTSYINVSNSTSNTKKVLNSIHEYGHAVSDAISPRYISYDSTYPFIELPSMTLEQLGAEFLRKANPSYEDITRKEELDYFFTLLEFAETLMIEYDALSKEKLTNPLKLAYISHKYGKNEKEKIAYSPAIQAFTYLVPYTASIELIHLYHEDPEEALYILKNILQDTKTTDYLSKLEELGIDLNTHTKEHINKIKTLSK